MAEGTTRTLTPGAAVVALIALVGVPLAIAFAIAGGGDSPDTTSGPSPTETPSTTAASGDPSDGAGPEQLAPGSLLDVSVVECGPLLTTDEIDAALGVAERSDGATPFLVATGESCLHTLVDHDDHYVQIGPGSPANFLEGARLLGVRGETVDGVGDEAIWFGGTDSESGGVAGVLAVRQSTPMGVVHFQVAVGRPDLDPGAQRTIATDLALGAVPRFPGVEPEPSPEPIEPEVVTFDPEPFDRSGEGFVANLLAKEEAGEWTRGEGLVATLQLFAGELEASEVLRQPELDDHSATGLVALAEAYAESGPDEAARNEIIRLLAELPPIGDELEAISTEDPAADDLVGEDPAAEDPAADDEAASAEPAFFRAGPKGAALASPTGRRAQPETGTQEECQDSWGISAPCLVVLRPFEGEAWHDKYKVLRPVARANAGWQGHVDPALEAMRKAATEFEGYRAAEMPKVQLALIWPFEPGHLVRYHAPSDTCNIFYSSATDRVSHLDAFRQRLARDMAYCLIFKTYPGAIAEGVGSRMWWPLGLALYLSEVVYPHVNWEHGTASKLMAIELAYSLEARGDANWAFFEWVHRSIGTEGILREVGSHEVSETLAGLWHSFGEELSEARVDDTGTNGPPYQPPPAEIVAISGPITMTPHPDEFGIARGQLLIELGKVACLTYRPQGPVVASWRVGSVGVAQGGWSRDLPAELTSDAVFVVTATGPGAKLTIEVTKLIDLGGDEKCEEETEPDGRGASIEPCNLIPGCDQSGYYFYVPGVGRRNVLPEFCNSPVSGPASCVA